MARPVLADLRDEPFVRADADRLDELRLSAAEAHASAQLELGRHALAIPELERLVGLHPLRERLTSQLMVALYRCDRQADALSVYGQLRQRLVEELGIDPSEELRHLEQQILVQDSALRPGGARAVLVPSPPTAPPRFPSPAALARRDRALVGRQRELAVVDDELDALADLATADRRVLMLCGEPGIGIGIGLQALVEISLRLEEVPVVLVGAYRDGELVGPLGPALDRVRREAQMTVVPLAGLDRAESADPVSEVVGETEGGLLDGLHSRTKGNPLFLAEYARSLPERSAGSPPRRLELEVPEGIRAVVRQRLGTLHPMTADILARAEVCGRELDFASLVTIADHDEDTVIAAIEEATAANLVVELSGNGERITFTHAVVRDTLYDSFSSLRARRLHRRLADHLDDAVSADPRSVVELARHLLASDPGADVARVIGRAIDTAEVSFDQLAFDQADELYEQVLVLLDQSLERRRDRSREVLLGLARAQRATGLHDEARGGRGSCGRGPRHRHPARHGSPVRVDRRRRHRGSRGRGRSGRPSPLTPGPAPEGDGRFGARRGPPRHPGHRCSSSPQRRRRRADGLSSHDEVSRPRLSLQRAFRTPSRRERTVRCRHHPGVVRRSRSWTRTRAVQE